ncbi:hypothetical protein BpHYR1_005669 [Brachionus plicatilis]|uniref:CCHC-type domain-containing protein n=1 Tax=Brachionus plicatilis TaxID=10195 RepID=A0A3M7Q000_BRAPC|nr:hypothetical protein BpHYR1_005669 [Brachionus plicatilis]
MEKKFKFKTSIMFTRSDLPLLEERPQITGINEIGQIRILIPSLGEKPRCLKCNETGHIKRQSPNNNQKCFKCQKFGQLSNECNFAKMISTVDANELPGQESEIEVDDRN